VNEEKLIYHGRIVDLVLESTTLPNGRAMQLEVVRHPGGAAVVALDEHGRVCLLRQYRHAHRDWIWELPAGKLDPGEPPLATAQRELIEEAGRRAARWSPLGRIITSPGVFTEIIHLYLAEGLEEAPAAPEEHELFEVYWLPLRDALERALTGAIEDSKTIVGLARAARSLEVRE
jgi:ADP-ribose pyrophosphatase